MKRFLIGGVLATAFALTACASTPEDPATMAAANRQITCAAGPDCDAKWSRAVGWIVANSRWKIQVQTDVLIQTFGPRSGDTDVAFTVTKVATGSGAYEIDIQTSCQNLLGCHPTGWVEMAALVNFIDPPK